MARKQADVFGFDQFQKSMEKMRKRYPVESDLLLATEAFQIKKRVKQITPVGKYPSGKKKGGTLRKGWRDLKPKSYQGGKVQVSRVQNAAPHAHLLEYGHEIYTTNGRKTGKVAKYNGIGRRVVGIKSHGKTEGLYLLDKSMKEANIRYPKSVQELINKITKEVEM